MPEGSPLKARLLEWLMLALFMIGLLYLVKYAPGFTDSLRMTNPRLGAWWGAHQFHIIEAAATALGLALGMSIGRVLVANPRIRARCTLLATILSLLVLVPLVHLCEMAARLGWDASGEAIRGWLIERVEDYERGVGLHKLVIREVYVLKTVGFGLIAGLTLLAVTAGGLFVTGANRSRS